MIKRAINDKPNPQYETNKTNKLDKKHAVCPIFGQAIFIIRKSFNLEQEYKFCKDQSLGRSACIFTNKLKLCRRYLM